MTKEVSLQNYKTYDFAIEFNLALPNLILNELTPSEKNKELKLKSLVEKYIDRSFALNFSTISADFKSALVYLHEAVSKGYLKNFSQIPYFDQTLVVFNLAKSEIAKLNPKVVLDLLLSICKYSQYFEKGGELITKPFGTCMMALELQDTINDLVYITSNNSFLIAFNINKQKEAEFFIDDAKDIFAKNLPLNSFIGLLVKGEDFSKSFRETIETFERIELEAKLAKETQIISQQTAVNFQRADSFSETKKSGQIEIFCSGANNAKIQLYFTLKYSKIKFTSLEKNEQTTCLEKIILPSDPKLAAPLWAEIEALNQELSNDCHLYISVPHEIKDEFEAYYQQEKVEHLSLNDSKKSEMVASSSKKEEELLDVIELEELEPKYYEEEEDLAEYNEENYKKAEEKLRLELYSQDSSGITQSLHNPSLKYNENKQLEGVEK